MKDKIYTTLYGAIVADAVVYNEPIKPHNKRRRIKV